MSGLKHLYGQWPRSVLTHQTCTGILMVSTDRQSTGYSPLVFKNLKYFSLILVNILCTIKNEKYSTTSKCFFFCNLLVYKLCGKTYIYRVQNIEVYNYVSFSVLCCRNLVNFLKYHDQTANLVFSFLYLNAKYKYLSFINEQVSHTIWKHMSCNIN